MTIRENSPFYYSDQLTGRIKLGEIVKFIEKQHELLEEIARLRVGLSVIEHDCRHLIADSYGTKLDFADHINRIAKKSLHPQQDEQ